MASPQEESTGLSVAGLGLTYRVTPKLRRPPAWVAVGAVAAGAASMIMAFLLHGAAGWLGWALGFVALIAGVGYRAETRRRQIQSNFRSCRWSDRVTMLGVSFAFIGVVANALVIAQRVVP